MRLDDEELTLTHWLTLPLAEREVLVDQLLERLPSTVSRVEGEGRLPHFIASSTRFVFVPATSVIVGLTAERAEQAYAALERSPFQIWSPEVHAPSWVAQVPMHLAGTSAMLHEGYEWATRQSVPDLCEELVTCGWRAPSEAEWELQFWSLRALVPIAFSPYGELCRDTWAPGYTLPFEPGRLSRGSDHQVVRVASFDPNSPSSALPMRRPLRSTSMISVRPVIEIPHEAIDR
jgi:hypothetical protein